MELARSWFRQGKVAPPEELLHLLASSPRLADLQLLKGVPELVTDLDKLGEGRNHDLWLLGRTDQEQVTICIEAKADEPFGDQTVAKYYSSASRRREAGESTSVPERINNLLSLVSGPSAKWNNVRYQLLTAICGTAIQAQRDGSSLAVLAVHEFRTTETKPDKLDTNRKDFEFFMTVARESQESVTEGIFYGPVAVGGIDCLIGKAVG
jgi:hypothetical protein